MPICINPQCATYNQNHPQNDGQIKCQFCQTELLLKNRYWVTKLLSDNTGFGLIYLADHFGNPKILKVLQAHHNHNAKVVNLFQKEAQILTSIKQQHPDLGIPAIDEYFTLPLGTQYIAYSELHCIVMEYVGNQDLSKIEKITDQKLALDYCKQLVNILHFIHQANYFHRDIKPSNIMIFSSGINQGKLCLIDFGTAREMTATYLGKIGGNQGITKISSGGYSPPEQQQGQAVPQSDFYALGRTFVFLLTKIEPSDPQMYDPMNNSLNWRGHTENMRADFLDLIDYLICEKAGERPKNTQEILDRLSIIEKNITPVNPSSVNPQPQINVAPSQNAVNPAQKNTVNPLQKNKKALIMGLFLLLLGGFGYYRYAIIDYNNRGLAKYNVKDYEGAIADYNMAIKLDSNYTLAYNGRGNAKKDLKDYQGALADYNQAIKLDPNGAYAYYGRGAVKFYLKDYKGAIADCNQAIKLDSNLAKAYNARGNAKKNLKDYEGAIADYNMAIKLDSNFAWPYNNRGYAKYELKDYQGAIADYNQAIKIDPNYAWFYNNRGSAKDDLKDYEGAIADYTQAIKLDPNDANAYYNRGLAHEKLGNKTQAISDFQKAAELYKEQGNEIWYQNAINSVKRLQN